MLQAAGVLVGVAAGVEVGVDEGFYLAQFGLSCHLIHPWGLQ